MPLDGVDTEEEAPLVKGPTQIATKISDLPGPYNLYHITKTMPGCKGMVVARLESSDPGCSPDDRIVRSMIIEAEACGKIQPGQTMLVGISSLNSGVGLAFVAKDQGYPIHIFMSSDTSVQVQNKLELFGAEVHFTSQTLGIQGALKSADAFALHTPNTFMLRPFESTLNPLYHFKNTARQIWDGTGGKLDFLVTGVGSGGTLSGVARLLKQANPQLKFIAVEPSESDVLSGGAAGPHLIEGIGAGFVPVLFALQDVSDIIQVSSKDAISWMRLLATVEGLIVSVASGAAACAADKVARAEGNEGKMVVAMMQRVGEGYLHNFLVNTSKEEARTPAAVSTALSQVAHSISPAAASVSAPTLGMLTTALLPDLPAIGNYFYE